MIIIILEWCFGLNYYGFKVQVKGFELYGVVFSVVFSVVLLEIIFLKYFAEVSLVLSYFGILVIEIRGEGRNEIQVG